jgi:hypothetical protein
MLFHAGAMRMWRGGMLKFSVCFVAHKFSLAVIPALLKKTANLRPTILADLWPSLHGGRKEEGGISLPQY